MTSSSFEALILDYGDVLSWPQPADWFHVMAERLGVTADAFQAAYWQHRPPYNLGLVAEEYWRRVLATLSSVSRSSAPPTIESLIQSDVASWTHYREGMWGLARAVRERGGRTAFLSNGVPEVMAQIRADRSLPSWFDAVVVSCEVGVAKPEPLIYRICLSRLGVEPQHALFVDDRIENLVAAAALGLRTVQFTGDDAVGKVRAFVSLPMESPRKRGGGRLRP